MRLLSPLLALLCAAALFPALPEAASPPCFGVSLASTTFSPSENQTSFAYTLTSRSGSGCPSPLGSLLLETSIPLTSSLPLAHVTKDPASGLAGYLLTSPSLSLGASLSFTLNIEGHQTSTVLGTWAAASAAGALTLGDVPLPAGPGSLAPCASVHLRGSAFSAPLNRTLFTYSVSVLGADHGCQPLAEWMLEVNCPIKASWPEGFAKLNDSLTGLSGYKFREPQPAGTEQLYYLSVAGHVENLVAVDAALVSQGAAPVRAETLAPSCDCNPGDGSEPEPTIPNQAPCVLVADAQVVVSAQTHRGSFEVSLGADPLEPVTVLLSSDCVFLSASSLGFDPTNWDAPQTVTVNDNVANPANCSVVLRYENDPGCSENVTVVKVPFIRDTTSSFGDPHIRTFDGFYHISHGTGDFYLVRQASGEMVLQARQDKCAGASCNYGLALRHRSALFYLILSKEGTPTADLVGDAAAEGMTVTASDNTYTVYLSNGVTVRALINYAPDRKVYYLSISLTAGRDLRGQLVGFCGYYDGVAANDMLLASGQLTSNLLTFQESWRVPQAENLFLNALAPVPAILGAQPPAPWGFLPATFSPEHDITADLAAFKSSASPARDLAVASTNGAASCTFANATQRALAEASCSPYFNSTAAQCCKALGVSGDDYYASCLCDFKFIGSGAFTLDNVQSFYDSCDAAAAAAAASPRCPTCPRACSGQGTCGADGTCACHAGFRGADCSQNWNLAPEVTAFSPRRAGFNCNTTLSITGSGFFGDVSCLIGSVLVPAVKMSDFQVSCAVPRLDLGQGVFSANVTVQVVRAEDALTSAPHRSALVLFESCCASPCLNGGRCQGSLNNEPRFSCSCFDTGYRGDRCQTFIDSCASGPCKNGGTCTNFQDGFLCSCAGTGYFGPECAYRARCPVVPEEGSAFWPSALSFTQSWGVCKEGYVGKPIRTCLANATFGEISRPCLPVDATCPSQTYSNALFPSTTVGTLSNGTCNPGFTGSPRLLCTVQGTWATSVTGVCQRNTCPSLTDAATNITWAASSSLSTLSRPCPAGSQGTLKRTCGADGTWGEVVGTCQYPDADARCPQASYGNAVWPETPAGQTASGSCLPGWAGTPRRACGFSGGWASLVSNHCVRA